MLTNGCETLGSSQSFCPLPPSVADIYVRTLASVCSVLVDAQLRFEAVTGSQSFIGDWTLSFFGSISCLSSL